MRTKSTVTRIAGLLGMFVLLTCALPAQRCGAAASFWLTSGSTTKINSGSVVYVQPGSPVNLSAYYDSGGASAFLVNLMMGYATTSGHANDAIPDTCPKVSLQSAAFVGGLTGYPPSVGGAFLQGEGSRPWGLFQVCEWGINVVAANRKLFDFTLSNTMSYGDGVTLTVWGADPGAFFGTETIWTTCLVNTNGTIVRPADNYSITLAAAPVVSPRNVKQLADGAYASVTGTVTASFGDFFYIEDTERIAGIRVNGSAQVTRVVTARGRMTTTDGERAITDASISSGSGTPIAPLGLTNSAVGGDRLGPIQGVEGGRGLNNLGLLVTTTGAVTTVDTVGGEVVLTIDDGSGAGIKVTGVTGSWSIGQYVSVTGIASLWTVGGGRQRMLRAVQVNALGNL